MKNLKRRSGTFLRQFKDQFKSASGREYSCEEFIEQTGAEAQASWLGTWLRQFWTHPSFVPKRAAETTGGKHKYNPQEAADDQNENPEGRGDPEDLLREGEEDDTAKSPSRRKRRNPPSRASTYSKPSAGTGVMLQVERVLEENLRRSQQFQQQLTTETMKGIMTHSLQLNQQNQECQARQQQQQQLWNMQSMAMMARLMGVGGGGSPVGPSMGAGGAPGPSMGAGRASGSGMGWGGVGGSNMASTSTGGGVQGDVIGLMSALMGAASPASGAQGPSSHAPQPPM